MFWLHLSKKESERQNPLHAITHVDGSARVQTINPEQDSLYYDLIKTFKKTGCSVLINTSMNVRGEPIVNTPEDAYLCFMRTNMDAIVIGPYILHKSEQPKMALKSAAGKIWLGLRLLGSSFHLTLGIPELAGGGLLDTM